MWFCVSCFSLSHIDSLRVIFSSVALNLHFTYLCYVLYFSIFKNSSPCTCSYLSSGGGVCKNKEQFSVLVHSLLVSLFLVSCLRSTELSWSTIYVHGVGRRRRSNWQEIISVCWGECQNKRAVPECRHWLTVQCLTPCYDNNQNIPKNSLLSIVITGENMKRQTFACLKQTGNRVWEKYVGNVTNIQHHQQQARKFIRKRKG